MPRVAVRAIVIENNHLLLCRYEDSYGVWHTTPGGGVEENETIEEAFRREMQEELGYQLPFGDIILVREILSDRYESQRLPSGFHQIEIYVQSYWPKTHPPKTDWAKALTTSTPLCPDKHQIGLTWHPLNELHNIEFYPKTLKAHFQQQQWEKIYQGSAQ
ncbi:NUDIX domain-containing protein [Marinibactrum halimedae]|uniref:Nudix hydrolase domain-containing protein n=1 Tax=Marinibactrum halimedae TaxID=1444977 RepID=A0AA37TA78_9GAMM|nr:NUDIX domain-containing protein [Marinibactrum halimedae]MCD9459595.1 NUDIX domain-containing protein [Marinibactrum halimedae]GLS25587.1 hypothetical protein GCM10007877_13010 [Marinibactrum halimedae]